MSIYCKKSEKARWWEKKWKVMAERNGERPHVFLPIIQKAESQISNQLWSWKTIQVGVSLTRLSSQGSLFFNLYVNEITQFPIAFDLLLLGDRVLLKNAMNKIKYCQKSVNDGVNWMKNKTMTEYCKENQLHFFK